MRSLLHKLGPRFLWDSTYSGGDEALFDYRRIWRQAVLGVASVSLVPLLVLAFLNHAQYRKALETETVAPLSRMLSDTKRSVDSFLQERAAAMDFIVHDNDVARLADQNRLTELFSHLQSSFRGFVDLGVIDASGHQVAYVGPYKLQGRNYKGQAWFQKVQEEGLYVSDVFRGFRNVPHLSIAARHRIPDGGFYVLRATINATRLEELLPSTEASSKRDAFIVNDEGILQTSSRNHGSILSKLTHDMPQNSGGQMVVRESFGPQGEQTFVGSVGIADSSFALVITQVPAPMLNGWWRVRGTLLGILLGSVILILIVVLVVVTYLVSHIYEADRRRTVTLHKIEHTNKMASIGRLAAGVAHEINNPLAIINEKAGLLKDLFTLSDRYDADDKIQRIVDSIIKSVDRCSAITIRLLGFAKHVEVELGPIDLEDVLREVLSLLGKEAEYREITITLSSEEGLPRAHSDRGQLQQIFLNIINNAFAAVDDGGHIDIVLVRRSPKMLLVTITDDGCGIAPENIGRVFEPFFSTKGDKGTGLGLSITYGLVQKLGGELSVKSKLDKGTTFSITLPVEQSHEADNNQGAQS